MSDRPTPETDAVEQHVQRDINQKWVLSNFAKRLERERDEARKSLEFQTKLNREVIEREKHTCKERDDLRAEVATLETRHAAVMLHTQTVVDENTELRTEVERAEIKTAAEYEAHRLTQLERDALRAEVETLKADRARLDWLSKLYYESEWNALFRISVSMKQEIREAIDAAMKGDK